MNLQKIFTTLRRNCVDRGSSGGWAVRSSPELLLLHPFRSLRDVERSKSASYYVALIP